MAAETVTYRVPEIHCEACERSIRRSLEPVAGVDEVAVDLERKEVRVTFDAAHTDSGTVRGRIERAGFDVE